MPIGKAQGLFRPERPDAEPFTIVNAAAQRHRLAAHRPCARQHAAGHPDPPRAAAGQGCACGWSAPTMPASRRRWWSSASSTSAAGQAHRVQPRGFHREGLGVEGARAAAQITRQLRRLGCSMRLGRTSGSRWTRASPRAVIKVFVDLYKQGLLYRDKRLVNWDPKLQTAISDLEVETQRGPGQVLALQISARRDGIGRDLRSRRRGRRRCSPTWRSRCTRTTSATRR